MAEKNEVLGNAVDRFMRRLYANVADESGIEGVYDLVMREVERRVIAATLDFTDGNKLKTAKILGLNRNTVLKKIRDLGLDDKMKGRKSE